MSTRSFVGLLIEENKVEYIYVHFDGHLHGVGRALLSTYNTEEKIRELLAEGDHSSVTVDCRESYKSRGEDDVDADVCVLDEYGLPGSGVDFVYLFQDGQWFYQSVENECEWYLVKEQI